MSDELSGIELTSTQRRVSHGISVTFPLKLKFNPSIARDPVKIGYVSTNYSMGYKADATFRLKNLTEEKVIETASSNLNCLKRILKWNVSNDILFFRISSNTVPFASHPMNTANWKEELRGLLKEVGSFIRDHYLRISMHPGQFTVINSEKREVVEASVRELEYHADLLDLMGVEGVIQIHVGSGSGGKERGLARFVRGFSLLPERIARRIAVENDDRIYTLRDCLVLNRELGIPVILDNLHHQVNSSGEGLSEAFSLARETWRGTPMTDYSSQEPGEEAGVHASTLDEDDFRRYVQEISRVGDADIMLEIRDKERSALKAVQVLRSMKVGKSRT
ncbi:UV DNA damage repair endonuclease UvsE [Metallosphaera javensis (ex Sakai et al. 2022)]|uniref:UV DNA damage repair endonuclease UvsE n=1 Tax=Metallosphaera javensis (ex Sakai et al. 2022) TaxID=2775498 RepID=UPI002587C4D9